MHYFLIALAGLIAITTATLLSRRTGIAAPLVLLVLGIGLSLVPGTASFALEPELVLAGVLPPLLYASAVRVPIVDLRRNFGMISWLSVVLVIVGAVVVGLVVHVVFPGVPLGLAIALGAVTAPTDAVAATSIGKRLGLPPRLMTVLEGESLVNDASSLVVLRTAVAAVGGSFSLVTALGQFSFSVAGGVVIGVVVGAVTVAVRGRLKDPVLTTTISFAVPFVAYFPAEEIGASGVLAVVLAGLVTGHRGAKRLSAADRQTEATNWATISFVLENGVFLLMGLQLPGLVERARAEGESIAATLALSGLVFALLLVLRFAGVGVATLVAAWRESAPSIARGRSRLQAMTQRVADFTQSAEQLDERRMASIGRRLARADADLDFSEREPLTRKGALVISWAGMRGVVTLAGALTIDPALPHRATIVLAAFVVAVATLLVYGGTLPVLIRRLGFEARSPSDSRAELGGLMQTLLSRSVDELGPLAEMTLDGQPVPPEVAEQVLLRFGPLARGSRPDAGPTPTTERMNRRQQTLAVQRRYLEAMRSALNSERTIGTFSTETYAQAESMLDREERRLDALGG